MEKFCKHYNLGELTEAPKQITGGLLHKMYEVHTTTGRYAIKILNPSIMEREEAVQNMIISEEINKQISYVISTVVAKEIDGNQLLLSENQYYMIYDWSKGASVFSPHITKEHCEKIGEVLGTIQDLYAYEKNSEVLKKWLMTN